MRRSHRANDTQLRAAPSPSYRAPTPGPGLPGVGRGADDPASPNRQKSATRLAARALAPPHSDRPHCLRHWQAAMPTPPQARRTDRVGSAACSRVSPTLLPAWLLPSCAAGHAAVTGWAVLACPRRARRVGRALPPLRALLARPRGLAAAHGLLVGAWAEAPPPTLLRSRNRVGQVGMVWAEAPPHRRGFGRIFGHRGSGR